MMTPEQRNIRRMALNARRHKAAETFLQQLGGMVPVAATVEASPPGYRLLVRQGDPPVWMAVHVRRLTPKQAQVMLEKCGMDMEGNKL